MTIAIDSVCTHAQLCDEVGGTQVLEPLLSQQFEEQATASDRTKPIREAALAEVMDALRSRTPPVYEADISDVTQLTRAVIWNSLARIYAMAMAVDGDAFSLRWNDYKKSYRTEITNLKPTVRGGAVAAFNTITLTRR